MGGHWSKKETATASKSGSTAGGSRRKNKTSSTKYKVVYTDREIKVCEQPRNLRTMFILRRTGSMFMDEDGHLAHEFYREKRVKNRRGVVRWIMERINTTQLIPQGEVKHHYPRLSNEFPLILLDSNATIIQE